MRHRQARDHVRDEVHAEEERGVGQRLGGDDLLPRDVDAREPRRGEDAHDDEVQELAVPRAEAHLIRPQTSASAIATSASSTTRIASSATSGALLRLRVLRLVVRGGDVVDADHHRVDGGNAIGLRERVVLAELGLIVDRVHRARLFGRVGIAVGDLERDDGDVVLAAAPVRGADQRLHEPVEVAALLVDELFDRPVVDHRGQAVGAEQEEVAGSRLDGERVDVDVRVGAERARDHRPLRVLLRFLRRQLAASHELGDEEWSCVSCSRLPSRTRYARESPT